MEVMNPCGVFEVQAAPLTPRAALKSDATIGLLANDKKNADRLLYTHGESRRGLWATLNSMRNVEGTGALRVHDWPPK